MSVKWAQQTSDRYYKHKKVICTIILIDTCMCTAVCESRDVAISFNINNLCTYCIFLIKRRALNKCQVTKVEW